MAGERSCDSRTDVCYEVTCMRMFEMGGLFLRPTLIINPLIPELFS